MENQIKHVSFSWQINHAFITLKSTFYIDTGLHLYSALIKSFQLLEILFIVQVRLNDSHTVVILYTITHTNRNTIKHGFYDVHNVHMVHRREFCGSVFWQRTC